MSANERLISKMSLEQKVRLITSADLYKSSPDGNYEFPVLELSSRPSGGGSEAFFTQFPSDFALAGSWDTSLVSEVYRVLGAEICSGQSYAAFNVAGGYNETQEKHGGVGGSDCVSQSPYLSGRFAASKIDGLSACGQYSSLEEIPVAGGLAEERSRLLRDIILNENAPDFAVFKSPDSAVEGARNHSFKRLAFGVATDCRQAAAYVYGGCSLVFLTEDFTARLVDSFAELTNNYVQAFNDYSSGKIERKELDRRCANLEILDEALIDGACDRLISLFMEMKRKGESASPEFISSIHGLGFDEVAHDGLALKAARSSIVLLKNQGVLPLAHGAKVAVLGGAAKDVSYQTEFFCQSATNATTAFEEINNYDIDTVGYADGYERGAAGRADLIAVALGLSASADVALVYLSAGRGERTLPQGQAELLNALYEKGIKTVAVLSADENFDFSFADKCSAVLFTQRGGQGVTRAALDIITGAENPSAHLVFTAYDGGNRENIRYPFGYGLSYTQFEYRNLALTPRGISCTVSNVGDTDGYAVVQLYVKKDGAKSMLAEKSLRGFSKVFIKSGGSVRVEIPFDKNTFRYYDARRGYYRVDGGEYGIFVGESAADEKLSGTLTLAAYDFKEKFSNEIEEESAGGELEFTRGQYPEEVQKAKKGLSAGLKIFVALLIAVYYNGMLATFAFTDIFPNKDLIFYCVIGGLALVADALIAAYIGVNAKKRRVQGYIPVNEVLSDMVKHVGEFDEIARSTYLQPVEETEDETAQAEEAQPEPETKKTRSYELNFAEEEETEVLQKFSFGALCADFREYCLAKGIAVEQSTVRSLVSALCTGRIVFVTSKNTEVFPEFLQALGDYFSGYPVTRVPFDIADENALLWRQEEDKFVNSDFVNAVYSAVKSPEKLCVAVLDEVETGNVYNYFTRFIDYASHPTEEHTLNLNEELSFSLPDNIRYVLATLSDLSDLPRELADCSLLIDAVIGKTDASGGEAEVKSVSLAALEEAVSEARENNFLPEKTWKKLDELEETVRLSERFKLGNKNTLQLERFTSVLLECGADEAEGVTALFLSKVVPVLKTTKTYKKDGGEKTLSGIIEKLFPDSELAAVAKSLSKNK